MQGSLINLQQSERIREGERILRQESQHDPYCRIESVEHSANLQQKHTSKVTVLFIVVIGVIVGGMTGGAISNLIISNFSMNLWWIALGVALGSMLGILAISVLIYDVIKDYPQELHLELKTLKEKCTALKEEYQEVAL